MRKRETQNGSLLKPKIPSSSTHLLPQGTISQSFPNSSTNRGPSIQAYGVHSHSKHTGSPARPSPILGSWSIRTP